MVQNRLKLRLHQWHVAKELMEVRQRLSTIYDSRILDVGNWLKQ